MVRTDLEKPNDVFGLTVIDCPVITGDVDAPTPDIRWIKRMIFEDRIKRIREKYIATFFETLPDLLRQF